MICPVWRTRRSLGGWESRCARRQMRGNGFESLPQLVQVHGLTRPGATSG